MLSSQQIDELISTVADMDHENLVDSFLSYHGRFPIDCTREFLDDMDDDRLRHIFVALCMQNGRLPRLPAAA